MQLFELKDYVLTWSEEAYALKPFADLIKRDKTKEKLVAIGELSFIFYFTDGRSDFHSIIDEEDRIANILNNITGLKDGWEPDAKVKVAIDFYRERSRTISSILLEDAEITANKLGKFLRSRDLDERDDNGKYVNDPSKITSALEKMPKIVDSLQETKKKVQRELLEKDNARGSVDKAAFEDGI